MDQRPGSIEGYSGRVIVKGAREAAAGAGEPTFARLHTGHGADEQKVESSGKVIGDTVHIDIIDKAGNMFTSTPSGGWLQSSPGDPGARAGRWARAGRCSGWRRDCPAHWPPASGRARRSRSAWPSATASPT
jgi:hypothetical protein